MDLELGCVLCALSELRCAKWNADDQEAQVLDMVYDAMESGSDQLVELFKAEDGGSVTMKDAEECKGDTNTKQALLCADEAAEEVMEMMTEMKAPDEMVAVAERMSTACKKALEEMGISDTEDINENEGQEEGGPSEFSEEGMP